MRQIDSKSVPHFLKKQGGNVRRQIRTDSYITVERHRFHTLVDHGFSELSTHLTHQFHSQDYAGMWDTLHAIKQLQPEHTIDLAKYSRLKVKALTQLMLDAIKLGDERAVQALQQAFPEFDLVQLQYKDPAATPESLREYAERLKQHAIAERFAIHVHSTNLGATVID